MANEYDGREDAETLESLTDGAEARTEKSFDDFLNRKVQKKCEPIPISRLVETDVPDAEVLSNESSSENSEEPDEKDPTPTVPAVEEKQLKIDLHKHEIVGFHISEQHVTIEIDEEYKEHIFGEFKKAVTEMSAEEIIERRHALSRAITLLRARDTGLQLALEEVLKSRNSKDRAALLELEAQLRAQRSKRVVTGKRAGLAKKTSKPSLSIAANRDKDTRRGISLAKTLIGMDYDQAGVIANIKKEYLTEGVLAFIRKHFEV